MFIQAPCRPGVVHMFGRLFLAMRSLTMRDHLFVHVLATAHRHVQPALDAGTQQFLGIRQFHVVDADRNVVLVRLFDERTVNRRRQRRLTCRRGRRPRS